nr:MAG TPA: hypothetical protein [Caudoviricetes sp.]
MCQGLRVSHMYWVLCTVSGYTAYAKGRTLSGSCKFF